MTEKQDIYSLLNDSALFDTIDAATISELAQSSQIIRKKKNENLFDQDSEATHCYYLTQGHVKLSRSTEGGDETVLDVLSPGSLVGETSFFNNDLYSYSADIVNDAALIRMPAKIVRDLVKKDPHFCCQMLRHLGEQSLEKDKDLERRTLQETSHRIGCFLLNLCEETSNKPATIELPYEKILIAKKLGMRPETFSRGLQKLQKDLGAEVDGMNVKIRNVEELSSYTCTACSYSLSCPKSALAGG